MGQTLTHGVYLPDEGERNCYNGLAGNWQLLDNSVGTIAEHTSALAGKAPLVHTHTKSDITDFPAYGNAAGTICEGNDSRLSDARTPVAHTHGKADITDLFNSVNVWTENNRFSKNAALSDITSYADTSMSFTGNSNTIFFNTRGSKNYPSYGTFLFAGYSTGTAPNRLGQLKLMRSTDKNGEASDGYTPDSSFNLWRVAPHYLIMDMMEAVRVTNDGTENSLKPITTNATDLGTSTNKWKSLNGINPGALSIPDGTDAGANSSFTPDTTDWPKDGTAFQANMPIVGWLRITIKNVAGNYAFVRRGTAGANLPWHIFADPSFAADFAECTLNVPVTNATYTLKINSPGGFTAKVYPCLGNV